MNKPDHRDDTIEEKEGGSPAARELLGEMLSAEPDAEAPFSEATKAWLGDVYEHQSRVVADLLDRRDISPETARDMLHDQFVTLGEYVRDHAVPKNEAAMLVTMTKHAIFNHGRRRKHRPAFDDDACTDDAPTSQPDGERRVHIGECEQIVAAILATMTPEAGELIRLIDLQDLSHAEAAAKVERRVELVKKQHERAFRKFEQLVHDYFHKKPCFDE
jgi:RNA polymerase sigma factor (sigma-70 family)